METAAVGDVATDAGEEAEAMEEAAEVAPMEAVETPATVEVRADMISVEKERGEGENGIRERR